MIKEILERALGLEVHETRTEEPEYHEMVIYSRDLNLWENIFREVMGAAVKPSGSKATAEQVMITEEYGGIEKTQTLYVRRNDSGAMMIMLWPWQDGERITVKMVFMKGG
ncbi:MAG TPA: hypothetical protein PKZ41_02570 [Candidatus Omnitrophota bacterium]|nr:hypothetical protein [Candidatus Omnitrophota bacterium]